MENENTLVITPESTAEQIVLNNLSGAKVEIRKPEPFQMNVNALVVKKEH